MNLEHRPKVEELRELLRACDDRDGYHVLWVARDGEVRISRIPAGAALAGFLETRPEMQLRYETFEAGNGYVGPEAADDDDWVHELFTSLTREWAKVKGRPMVACVGQL